MNFSLCIIVNLLYGTIVQGYLLLLRILNKNSIVIKVRYNCVKSKLILHYNCILLFFVELCHLIQDFCFELDVLLI